MKYFLPIILLIVFASACKKKDASPPSFSATLNGKAYPANGEYANWNNWQNGSTITSLGADTMLIVSSQWGYTDTDYSASQVTLYPVLEFDIRGLEDSTNANLTFDEKYLNLIKTGSLKFCNNSSNLARCASIQTLNSDGATVFSTDYGDNAGSTFSITGNGAQTNIYGNLQTSYTVTFSCKLYTGTGTMETLNGTCVCLVNY